MKIVILDAYTVDQGELTWDGLNELAEVEAYERTSPDEVIERCKGAEMVLTNKVVLDASVLNMLPRLQYIGENRSGRWTNSPDFCYLDHDLFELNGKKMGIIGLGNTGMATARIATGFGLQVLAYTSKDEDDLPYGIKSADLDTIFEQCDIVSLHCPLTEDTRHLVNTERLATMKSSAILINTGRGPLVDDAAVAEALNSDQLAAYGADVLTTEPPTADNPLLSAKNSYLTPHIAWATREARQRLINICTENVRAYLDGEPVNQVN